MIQCEQISEPVHGSMPSTTDAALKALGRTTEADVSFAKSKELGYTGGSQLTLCDLGIIRALSAKAIADPSITM